jgi:porin
MSGNTQGMVQNAAEPHPVAWLSYPNLCLLDQGVFGQVSERLEEVSFMYYDFRRGQSCLSHPVKSCWRAKRLPPAARPWVRLSWAGISSAVMFLAFSFSASPVLATPPSAGGGSSSDDTPPPASGSGPQSGTEKAKPQNFFSGLTQRNALLGDLGGVRRKLSKYGVTLNILETSEVLGNAAGGRQKGADYDGLTQVDLQMDTQRAFRHYGGTLNVSALQIHGTNLSADNLLTLQTASGIEADRATRLWEVWYDQKYFEENNLDVKVGQQSLDQEFMVSQNALLFVNTMFGWAMVPSADLPGGGPAYPLSALGIRAAYRPTTATNFLAGVYTGSPTPNNSEDPQKANPNGVSFPTHNGELFIAEAQFIYPALGSLVYAGKSAPLPRIIKFGGWYDTEKFADQRYDISGLSLASPASSGIARSHRGDYSLYGTLDQMVYHSEDDYDRSLNLFARVMAAPQGDRNLVDYSANLGLVLTDPLKSRDDDSTGIGLGYAKVGSGASGLDGDTAAYTSSYNPKRTSELFVEGTYSYEVFPWLRVQPDVQYVFNPGGGIANPNDPSRRVGNELVLGLRANIQL